MSKVICEICGTAYPDTEKECPVCGFEKPETAEFAPDDTAASAGAASGYVRGGRFSKSNVSRKSSTAGAASRTNAKGRSSKKNGSDVGLIIAIILLLLSIICFGAHIYFTYFAYNPPVEDALPVETTTQPTQGQTLQTQPQDTTEPEDLSCTGLTLYEQSVVLNKAGSEWLLNVVPTPANTTDEITYSSADQNVATVSADGKIVAVANGETVITVTCGSVSVECKVICQIPEETEPKETEPEETEPEETQPKETEAVDIGDFKLRKTDITFDAKGQTYTLYKGDIDVKDIKWTVGNSAVATVKDGVVKAVGPGLTNVYAEYNGVKISCVVRCDF